MNNMKYTRQPWYVSTLADNTPVVQSVSLEEDNFICQVEGRDNDEAHANARLIVAAPQMLAELTANERLLAEYVEWHHKHQNGCSVEWEDRLEATRDVIAKATAQDCDWRQP